MRCADWRELVSARLDDELDDDLDHLVTRHLSTCPGCRAFADATARLTRAVRVRPAEAVPDLTEQILARVEAPAPRRDRRQLAARVVLAWIAAVQLALAMPALVLGEGDGGIAAHAARHLGSFDVAIAVGLLAAAWRPERARALLPVVLVLTASLALTGVVDLAEGTTRSVLEAIHLVDLVAVVMLWVVAGCPSAFRRVRAALPS